MTLRAARRFIGEHHSHNLPPQGWIVGTSAVDDDGKVVGVAMLGRPVGRGMDDGTTAEITRVCTTGTRNACSMLYGAMARAAGAIGYERAITYTLAEECAACVRAAGFVVEAELPERPEWQRSDGARVQVDLFGNDRRPPGAKVRWVRAVS